MLFADYKIAESCFWVLRQCAVDAAEMLSQRQRHAEEHNTARLPEKTDGSDSTTRCVLEQNNNNNINTHELERDALFPDSLGSLG